MKQEILQQRELMCKALDLINQMQTFEALFTSIDNKYLQNVLKPIQLQYAETMTELVGEITKLVKTKGVYEVSVIVHDQITY